MAEHATSTPAPCAAPPDIWGLRSLYIFAEGALEIVKTTEADDALQRLCDQLINRMIAAPIRGSLDAYGKIWLINLAGEREWTFDRFARPCLAQVEQYVRATRA